MIYVVRLSLVIHNNMFSITHSQCSPLSPPQVESVLRLSPNVLPWHEWNLRQVHQFIFLQPSTSEADYGLWLTKILKPYPITHQARLLYILTGPVDAAGMCVSK